jgi:hypothetical protein
VKSPIFALAFLLGFFPSIAQATTTKMITCEATLSPQPGVQLIYTVTGNVELGDDGKLIPTQSPSGDTALTVSVVRKDKTGKVQSWLNRGRLASFEQIAPDADYSQIPFDPQFRGLPNNGRGIYAARASTRGLYVSLRPEDRLPQRMQVVHYLTDSQFVRSSVGTCR